MVRSNQQEAFERLMSANLMRIIDLIKFAETKNAALLTFCSAWILGSLNVLASGRSLPAGYLTALAVAVPLFLIAALIALASFAPQIKFSRSGKAHDRYRNLLFFGDISALGLEAFKKQAKARYLPNDGQSVAEDYIDDLMAQVVVHSTIANRKFRLFNWGSRVVLIAIAALAVPAILLTGNWMWRVL